MINLLNRTYAPTRGKVFFDGRNVATYTTDELRARIKIVLQKTLLFKGSVRENLSLGAENATDEDLLAALEAAQASDFVEKRAGLTRR